MSGVKGQGSSWELFMRVHLIVRISWTAVRYLVLWAPHTHTLDREGHFNSLKWLVALHPVSDPSLPPYYREIRQNIANTFGPSTLHHNWPILVATAFREAGVCVRRWDGIGRGVQGDTWHGWATGQPAGRTWRHSTPLHLWTLRHTQETHRYRLSMTIVQTGNT
jgi:hypothetical protein